MKRQKNHSKFEREKHIFYNLLSLKFREMTKYDLKFLGNRILKLDIKEAHKNKFIPLLIGEIYKILIERHDKNELFWKIVDFLSHFLSVALFYDEIEPIFYKLSSKEIIIKHNMARPDFIQYSKNLLANNDKIMTKEGILCLCSGNEVIRKTHKCYVCGVKAHKACFFWNDKNKNKVAQERQEEINKDENEKNDADIQHNPPIPAAKEKKEYIPIHELLKNSKNPDEISTGNETVNQEFSQKNNNDSENLNISQDFEPVVERPKISNGLETKKVLEVPRRCLTFNTIITKPFMNSKKSNYYLRSQKHKQDKEKMFINYRNPKHYFPEINSEMTTLIEKNSEKELEYKSLNTQVRNFPISSNEVDFICPFCILERYDPFFEVEEVLISPRIINNGDSVSFFVDPSICLGDKFVIIKSIQVSPEYNASQGENYNSYDIYFPKKGTLKVNGCPVKNFKPEKNGFARRKDYPVVCNISKDYYGIFKEIPQRILSELHVILLDYLNKIKQYGNCDQLAWDKMLYTARKLLPDRFERSWHIALDLLINQIFPSITKENLSILEKNCFKQNYFPDGIFSMLKMTSKGSENQNSHINLIKGYRGCIRLGLNHFQMQYETDVEESVNNTYIMAIYMCRHRTAVKNVEKIIQRQSQSGRMMTNYLNNMRFIRNTFRTFDDSFRISVSLLDPLTLTRIRVPVRGDQCNHVNVFCLETYMKNLENSEIRRTKCPFCGKTIVKLIIDFMMLKAINEHRFLSLEQELKDEIMFVRDQDYTIDYYFQKFIDEDFQIKKKEESRISNEEENSNSNIVNSKQPENLKEETIKEENTFPEKSMDTFFNKPNFMNNKTVENIMKKFKILNMSKNQILMFIWNLRGLLERYSNSKKCSISQFKAYNINLLLKNLNFGSLDILSLEKISVIFKYEILKEPEKLMKIPQPPIIMNDATKHSPFIKNLPSNKFLIFGNSKILKNQPNDLRIHSMLSFPFSFNNFEKRKTEFELFSFFENIQQKYKIQNFATYLNLKRETGIISKEILLKYLSLNPFSPQFGLFNILLILKNKEFAKINQNIFLKDNLSNNNTLNVNKGIQLKELFQEKCKKRMKRIINFPYRSNLKNSLESSFVSSNENSKSKKFNHKFKKIEKNKQEIALLEEVMPKLVGEPFIKNRRSKKYFIIERSLKKQKNGKRKKRMKRLMSSNSSMTEDDKNSDNDSAFSVNNINMNNNDSIEVRETRRRRRRMTTREQDWGNLMNENEVGENEFVPKNQIGEIASREDPSDSLFNNYYGEENGSQEDFLFDQEYGSHQYNYPHNDEDDNEDIEDIEEIVYNGLRQKKKRGRKKKRINKSFRDNFQRNYTNSLIDDNDIGMQRINPHTKKKRRKRFRLYEIAKMEMDRIYGKNQPKGYANMKKKLAKNYMLGDLNDSRNFRNKFYKKDKNFGTTLGININGNDIDFQSLGFGQDPSPVKNLKEHHSNFKWNQNDSSNKFLNSFNKQNKNDIDKNNSPYNKNQSAIEEVSSSNGHSRTGAVYIEGNDQFSEKLTEFTKMNMKKFDENQKNFSINYGFRNYSENHNMIHMKRNFRKTMRKLPEKFEDKYSEELLIRLLEKIGISLNIENRFISRNKHNFQVLEFIYNEISKNKKNINMSDPEKKLAEIVKKLYNEEHLDESSIVESYYQNVELHKEVFERAFIRKYDTKRKSKKEDSIEENFERKEKTNEDIGSKDELSTKTQPFIEAIDTPKSNEKEDFEMSEKFQKKSNGRSMKCFSDFAKRLKKKYKIHSSKRIEFRNSSSNELETENSIKYSKFFLKKLIENLKEKERNTKWKSGRGKQSKKPQMKFGEMKIRENFLYDDLVSNIERFKYIQNYFGENKLKDCFNNYENNFSYFGSISSDYVHEPVKEKLNENFTDNPSQNLLNDKSKFDIDDNDYLKNIDIEIKNNKIIIYENSIKTDFDNESLKKRDNDIFINSNRNESQENELKKLKTEESNLQISDDVHNNSLHEVEFNFELSDLNKPINTKEEEKSPIQNITNKENEKQPTSNSKPKSEEKEKEKEKEKENRMKNTIDHFITKKQKENQYSIDINTELSNNKKIIEKKEELRNPILFSKKKQCLNSAKSSNSKNQKEFRSKKKNRKSKGINEGVRSRFKLGNILSMNALKNNKVTPFPENVQTNRNPENGIKEENIQKKIIQPKKFYENEKKIKNDKEIDTLSKVTEEIEELENIDSENSKLNENEKENQKDTDLNLNLSNSVEKKTESIKQEFKASNKNLSIIREEIEEKKQVKKENIKIEESEIKEEFKIKNEKANSEKRFDNNESNNSNKNETIETPIIKKEEDAISRITDKETPILKEKSVSKSKRNRTKSKKVEGKRMRAESQRLKNQRQLKENILEKKKEKEKNLQKKIKNDDPQKKKTKKKSVKPKQKPKKKFSKQKGKLKKLKPTKDIEESSAKDTQSNKSVNQRKYSTRRSVNHEELNDKTDETEINKNEQKSQQENSVNQKSLNSKTNKNKQTKKEKSKPTKKKKIKKKKTDNSQIKKIKKNINKNNK